MSTAAVKGYTSQTNERVDRVNAHKKLEEQVLRAIDAAKAAGCDPRMCALAFTETQSAFMWLNRAVFQPARLTDAELG